MNESKTGDSIARRRERDRPYETVRAEWLDDGLSGSMYGWVEPLPEGRRRTDRVAPLRAVAGIVASSAGFIVIPLAGLVGGCLIPILIDRQHPELRADPGGCGNDGLIVAFFAFILGIVGLIVGAFLAFLFAQYALVFGLGRNDRD